jgi:hypothetical protein
MVLKFTHVIQVAIYALTWCYGDWKWIIEADKHPPAKPLKTKPLDTLFGRGKLG